MAGASTPSRHQHLVLGVTLCCALVVGLGMAELLLRVAGRRPVEPLGRTNEPTTNVPDPVLGWRMKPGSYRYPGYTNDAPPITLTIWPDGSRATRAQQTEQRRRIVLIGDSFTQGWAVSDDDTYAWKLQARFPAVEVVNYGTGGYNGVQALLRLEEHLQARPHPPDWVVYGFNEDQERRNVADPSWVGLLGIAPHRETVRLPYALLDGHGGLRIYPPEGYPIWPLRQRLALVPLLEQVVFKLGTRHRTEQQRPVTELLFDRMQEVVRERGSHLLVVLLAAPPDVGNHYVAHLATRGITFVDCRYPVTPELIVAGEGHPNGIAHTRWAECIGRFLEAGRADRR